jgi:hypothetical protein
MASKTTKTPLIMGFMHITNLSFAYLFKKGIKNGLTKIHGNVSAKYVFASRLAEWVMLNNIIGSIAICRYDPNNAIHLALRVNNKFFFIFHKP